MGTVHWRSVLVAVVIAVGVVLAVQLVTGQFTRK